MDKIKEANRSKILNIIAEQCGISIYSILPSDRLDSKHIYMDSLDLIETIMAIEHAFSIELLDSKFQGVSTVQQFIDIVEETLYGYV